MGLIGEEFDHLVYDLADSTNSLEVLQFFTTVTKLLKSPANTVVVIDNHSAHQGLELDQLFKEAGMIMLNLPVHSCSLNSIERIWAVWKKIFRLEMLNLDESVCKVGAFAMINKTLNMIPKTAIASLSKGCVSEMIKVMEGQVV